MSKRNGNVNDFNLNNIKRPKVDHTLDDLWGDDLDIDDVDNCLMLATQMCQQSVVCTPRNNQSILPSYSLFKQTSKQLFTSTQHEPAKALINGTTKALNDSGIKVGSSFKRAQSFDCANKNDGLELKVKTLQDQYEAKTGEVSILRAKLSDLKAQHDAEQTKTQKEWAKKLLVKSKELKAVESELEFKNLEIINLSQKLKEAAKLNHMGTTRSPFFKHLDLDRSTTADTAENKNDTEGVPFEIKVLSEQKYPLKNIKNHVFAVSLQDMCLKDVTKKPAHLNVGKRLDQCRSNLDILKLAQLNTYELDLVQNQKCIRKLLSFSEQLLQNLYVFLEKLKLGTCVDDTRTINFGVIGSESSTLPKNEMGFYAKETVICVSEALPYSSYLKQRIVLNSEGSYLALLLSIVKLIHELNLSISFDHFLQSIVSLLFKISQLFDFEKIIHNHIISDVTKELIYCLTSKSAFRHFLKYLNSAALQQHFLSSLCQNLCSNNVHPASNDKILCYTKNSCALQILFIILEEYLIDNCLDSIRSTLNFLSASIRCNPSWLFYKEDNCPCVSKIVKLYIDLIYKMLQIVKSLKDSPDELNLCSPVLMSGVDNMHTLNFNLYFLVAKYLETYSHYTVVVKSLFNMRDVLKLRDSIDLENLNTNEEIVSASKEAFQCTTLWKNSMIN